MCVECTYNVVVLEKQMKLRRMMFSVIMQRETDLLTLCLFKAENGNKENPAIEKKQVKLSLLYTFCSDKCTCTITEKALHNSKWPECFSDRAAKSETSAEEKYLPGSEVSVLLQAPFDAFSSDRVRVLRAASPKLFLCNRTCQKLRRPCKLQPSAPRRWIYRSGPAKWARRWNPIKGWTRSLDEWPYEDFRWEQQLVNIKRPFQPRSSAWTPPGLKVVFLLQWPRRLNSIDAE